MNGENICRFVPKQKSDDVLNIINFVYEANLLNRDSMSVSAVFSINLLTKGNGTLITSEGEFSLSEGDLFFIFPAVPYRIVPKEQIEFMYVSFLGIRGVREMEKMNITKASPVYSGFIRLYPYWWECIQTANEGNSELLSESVLLYTFANLSNELIKRESEPKIHELALRIKKYVDDSFTDSGLSLEKISEIFCYNKKYISVVFKKQNGVGFCEYLTTIRIQHACTLMENGLTSVKDIAYLCGYSDRLYFSKVFKRRMGTAPIEHISSLCKSGGQIINNS